MADVPVSNTTVCVDDLGKARVMEPIIADKISSLKDQCVNFLTDINLYREAVDGFIGVMDQLAMRVEREKREAIIVSNKLASLSAKTEEKTTMLRTEIERKTTELERCRIEHRSLQKIESEQIDLINQLSFQS